ncbi:hypothetical protein D3C78_1006610 [compost metagenome]
MTDMTAVVISASSVCGIFNHRDPITLSNSANGVNIDGSTGIMHRDNRLRSRRDGGFNRLWRHHQRVAVNVDHDGLSAQ